VSLVALAEGVRRKPSTSGAAPGALAASGGGVRLDPCPRLNADAVLAAAGAGCRRAAQPWLRRRGGRFPRGPAVRKPPQYPRVPRVYLSRWTQRSTSF